MSSKHFIPLLIVLLILAVAAADEPPEAGVIHLDHEKVAAVWAKGGPLLATNNFKILTLRRTEPGEVEIHDQDTDVVYVVDGTANFVTGGKAMDSRRTGPGEVRAKTIEGGEQRKLMKGDVMVIPNGVPHWFKEITSGPFLYFVVKVAK